jgi:hypothetical protein
LFSELVEASTPSTVSSGWLIKLFVKKIGVRTVLKILRGKLDSCPHVVNYALYHLQWQRIEDPRGMADYQSLYAEAERRGLIRQPVVSPDPGRPGAVLFSPIPPRDETPGE